MTERERYLAAVRFAAPAQLPLITMGPRESTLAAWREQGLPAGEDWLHALCAQIGLDYDFPQAPRAEHGVDFRMLPMFEEKVLAHRDGHYLVQDWMGNITEISDAFDVTYLRTARDFVTRKWHAFPVTTPADFTAMTARYELDTPGRFPHDFPERARVLAARDYVSCVSLAGPFWQMREWCGFEPLCLLFHDDPAFIAAMVQFWSDFVADMLARLFATHVPDQLLINEDMAYKGASMLSPAMTRHYLLPVWQRWVALARDAGVPVIAIDSDGNLDELIPLFIEAGFNLCLPIEVAAGCDIAAYRARFGTQIAYAGGIDKRCIARSGDDIAAEMARLRPVARAGGFIPGCDHGMPPDISWPHLLQFGRLWAEMTGWG
ncbi:MAG TPA: uroporphyrinogen decarboxylase family protein [Armatimonadota bacterium]